jgi:hypothetical protein
MFFSHYGAVFISSIYLIRLSLAAIRDIMQSALLHWSLCVAECLNYYVQRSL